jgi:predicted ArsR family transcriptional regulator
VQIAGAATSGITSGAVRVARVLLQDGPTTAPALAESLGLSTQAVRRHLDQLLDEGLLESSERPPFGPRPTRGRGRPPRVYYLTESGRDVFEQSYDDLAVAALRFMAAHGGEEQIEAFARSRAEGMAQRYAGSDLTALAEQMTADGYAATVVDSADGQPAQLCQHHCPVGHVAEEFPQLCEAETEAIGRILGRNVIRLATIAHGDGVCTTAIAPEAPATSTTRKAAP